MLLVTLMSSTYPSNELIETDKWNLQSLQMGTPGSGFIVKEIALKI